MKAYPAYLALCAVIILAGAAFLPRDGSLQGHVVAGALSALSVILIVHICRAKP